MAYDSRLRYLRRAPVNAPKHPLWTDPPPLKAARIEPIYLAILVPAAKLVKVPKWNAGRWRKHGRRLVHQLVNAIQGVAELMLLERDENVVLRPELGRLVG